MIDGHSCFCRVPSNSSSPQICFQRASDDLFSYWVGKVECVVNAWALVLAWSRFSSLAYCTTLSILCGQCGVVLLCIWSRSLKKVETHLHNIVEPILWCPILPRFLCFQLVLLFLLPLCFIIFIWRLLQCVEIELGSVSLIFVDDRITFSVFCVRLSLHVCIMSRWHFVRGCIDFLGSISSMYRMSVFFLICLLLFCVSIYANICISWPLIIWIGLQLIALFCFVYEHFYSSKFLVICTHACSRLS